MYLNNMRKISKKSGYSLVEMLIYVSILAILSGVIVNMLISMTSTYRTVVAIRIAEDSGTSAMERMTRDIRAASSLDLGASDLGTSNGRLSLIATSGAVSTTTLFYLDEGRLKVDINGTFLGPLTLSKGRVTSIVFRHLDNGITSAVKIDMTVEGQVGTVVKTKNFHSTVVLRGR